MKKLLAFLSLAGAMVISTGCTVTIGWDDTDFTLTGSIPSGTKEATITISWENGAKLKFNDRPTFTADDSLTVESCTYGEITKSSQEVKVTFNEEISSDVSGSLDFKYTNEVTGASGDNQEPVTITVQS